MISQRIFNYENKQFQQWHQIAYQQIASSRHATLVDTVTLHAAVTHLQKFSVAPQKLIAVSSSNVIAKKGIKT